MHKTWERFWRKVRVTKGCWEWVGCKNAEGYGHFRLNGKVEKAHRVMWFFDQGHVPHGRMVCHRCDNPSCVKPKHLFLGTGLDNMRDMARKGRAYTGGKPPRYLGEEHAQSILTEEQVIKIRAEYSGKYGDYTRLGKKYGVGRSCIYRIIVRDNWKHI